MSELRVPKRRFKEFLDGDAWELRKAKELCSITTGKSNTQDQIEDGIYPFFIRSDIPVLSNKYLYDCEAVITIGDGNIGKVFHYVNGKFDLHQRCYKMADFNDVTGKYFYYYFSTKFYERAMKMTAKATVDSVRLEMISEMKIYYPKTNAEQTAIGNFFRHLDNLITLHQRKLNKVKALKSAYLSEMFPAEGERKPKRRFAGFTDDWELRKLGEVVEICNGQDYKHLSIGDIPVYGTGGYMLSVNDALSYSEDAIGIGRKGTIDKPYILRAPFWTVDTLFYAIPKEKKALDFTHILFQKINWKQKDESTGVPSLSKTTINTVDVIIPNLAEQTAIGNFFRHLDNLITLHQRKLNKVKALKSAYLSEMFPAEGERKPKRRFAGFTDDWELRKLGEVADFNPKSDLPQIFEYVDLESVVGTEMIAHRTETKSFAPSRAQRLAMKGDLFYQMVRPYQKNNYLFEKHCGNYVFSTGYAQIRPHIDSYFLLCLVQNDFFVKLVLDKCTGTSYPAINSDDLSEIEVFLPTVETEQAAIGTFFRHLDNLITLHQRKLEKLQNLKKAYLNEMFI